MQCGRRVDHHLAPIIKTIVVIDNVSFLLVKTGIGRALTMRAYGTTLIKSGVVLRVPRVPCRCGLAQVSKLLVCVEEIPKSDDTVT